MARTIQEIYDSIVAQKDAESTLSGLTSASLTAIWRLWAYITATVIYTHEVLWDLFQADIQTLIDNNRIGTVVWYILQAKLFQVGDTLIENADGSYGYATVDTDLQIVTNASFVETGGVLAVKVAKGDLGALEPLDNTEKTQFTAYMNQIKVAGTLLQIISIDGDLLVIEANIYYNPLYDEAAMTTRVTDSINTFLLNLPFDGVFLTNRFIDYVTENSLGVIDVEITDIKAVSQSVDYPIDRSYTTQAGYMNFDDGSSTLTFIANG